MAKKITLSIPSLPEKLSFLKKFKWNKDLYNPILVVLLIIAAFFLGSLYTKVQYLEGGKGTIPTAVQGNNQGAQPTPGAKVEVDPGKFPALGKKDAKVTVIVFADFQCPFCEKLYKDALTSIKKDYADSGKVKLYYRNYAFLGDESKWSAEAAECANEQGKFWEMHDYLFNNQGAENSGAFSKDKLKGFAQALGLNTEQFNSCLDTDKYAKAVADDLAAGQKAGVTGTPATFVNGISLVGAQPYSAFKTLIDQELAK